MPVSFGMKPEGLAAGGAALLLHGGLAALIAWASTAPRPAAMASEQTVAVNIAWAPQAWPEPAPLAQSPTLVRAEASSRAYPAPTSAVRPEPPKPSAKTSPNTSASTNANTQPDPHEPVAAAPSSDSDPLDSAASASLTAVASSTANAAQPSHTAPAAPTPPSHDGRWLLQPVLVYPLLSRQLGEQGTVVVRVLVDEEGWPRQPTVLRSSGFARLDQAALRHILASRFVPGRVGEQPLAMWHDAPVQFRLQ